MNLLTPEQRAREVELKSIYQYCDKTKRLLLSADDATDIDKRRALIAEYNRRVRAVNVRIRALRNVPVAGDWVSWTGGSCPVQKHVMVEYVMATSQPYVSGPEVAGNLSWGRDYESSDIIRYRVISE